MNKQFWTAAAVMFAVSGTVAAGEMSPGSSGASNPASSKGVKTPSQPNETQPGMASGAGDVKSDKGRAKGSAQGQMKSDVVTGGTGMQAGSGSSGASKGASSNLGNPAEKGAKTPSQPNETQPGMGSHKK